ncbi:MAG: amino acid permease [Deltaproteobacteria bacterium]|nr:amino acid permease [Candidatus Zymogenaceae bacterium]
MEDTKLARSIGLVGAVAITVGCVIGMSIFVLIGDMASLAGPALPLAFLFALIPALFNVITVAQLGSAIPRAGGGYVFTSRIISPFWGLFTSWFIILAIIGALSTVGVGLAQYVNEYLPFGLSDTLTAVLIVGAFVLVNAVGLVFAEAVQIIMVGQMIIALLIFGAWGLFGAEGAAGEPAPFFIGGFSSIALASVLCYFSYIGFATIAELGEEMRHPKENIPRSIGIAAVIIFILYALISVVFNKVMGYNPDELAELGAPLTQAGWLFLPAWAVHFLSIGALGAGLTSINAGVIGMPREIFAQSRDGMMPSLFQHVTKKQKTPIWAILAVFPPVMVLLLFNLGEDFYGFLAVGALLLTNITIAFACMKLPKIYPDDYERSPFKISRGWLTFISWAAVVTSGIFIVLILLDKQNLIIGAILAGWCVLIMLYYWARKRFMIRSGMDLEKLYSTIPGYEED